ncbi:hypothetical protein GY45DRAFT_1401272 [Cubamyces sp. BRFM 1775]|nr:hypothetical protein GY45DRAFT_1401272 [Cubamyces sp. BRFM 1775]
MPLAHIQSTPIAKSRSTVRCPRARGIGHVSVSALFATLEQFRAAAVEDMAHKAVRVDAATFADMFFPLPAGVSAHDHPEWPTDVFDELSRKRHPRSLCALPRNSPLRAFDGNDLAPGCKLTISSEKPDIDDMGEFKLKVDAALFRTSSVPTDGRPHWADQLVPVELKRHETNQDPFDDRDENIVDASAFERKKARGQIISYAEMIFRVQHRIALFMLLIIGRHFRFLRWDRSGTIVTRAVDYVSNPHVLCEMLWRMSLQSDEQLGIDPSATRLFPHDYDYKLMDILACESKTDMAVAERKLMSSEVPQGRPIFKHERLLFQLSIDRRWARYRLEVPDGVGTQTFLVGGPSFHAPGMSGRGTKGFVAWDCQRERFVWLKDAWRLDYEEMEREGDILQRLNDLEVANVPTVICHGDIRNQTTKTPEVWELQHPAECSILVASSHPGRASTTSSSTLVASSASSLSKKRSRTEDTEDTLATNEECPLRRHAHYRLVVDEVCLPLSEFTSGRQLLLIVLYCLRAHKDACEKAKIMHRDISSGNILIYPRLCLDEETKSYNVHWTGILADWELSKPVGTTEPLMRPRQPPRTGTWQFLSAGMLSTVPKAVEIQDELESFLHVVLYHSVRYLESNCKLVAQFIESYFDAYIVDDGVYTCGAKKLAAVKTRGYLEVRDKIRLRFNTPMDDVFCEMLPLFKAHYAIQEYLNEQRDNSITLDRPSRTNDSPHFTASSSVAALSLKLIHKQFSQSHPSRPTRSSRLSHSGDSLSVKPSPAQEADAALVTSHDHMIDVLLDACGEKDWGLKVGDRVPVDYTPQYLVGPADTAAPGSVKRLKTASTADFSSCMMSFPVRYTQSESAKPKTGR